MDRMSGRENMLRTILFGKPEHIPVAYAINASCYFAYDPEDILDLQARHPLLFPDFVRPRRGEFSLEAYRQRLSGYCRKDLKYRDSFGCIWETPMDGLTGTVTGHPLANLEDFANYRFPDPEKCDGLRPMDWEKWKGDVARAKAAGHITGGGLVHGHTFLRLTYLCGYENFLYAMEDEAPELEALIQGVTDFNCTLIQKALDADVDVVYIPEDLGMQHGPMISLENFRKYIKPSYQRMMDMVRSAGKIVHMHSDGDIRQLAPDIVEGGCQVINLQDLVNGIDWIAENFRGKTCVELDIDRQDVTFRGSPKDIDDLIREEVEKLNTPMGGLMMIYGLYPGVPMENAEAVAAAMEKYAYSLS